MKTAELIPAGRGDARSWRVSAELTANYLLFDEEVRAAPVTWQMSSDQLFGKLVLPICTRGFPPLPPPEVVHSEWSVSSQWSLRLGWTNHITSIYHRTTGQWNEYGDMYATACGAPYGGRRSS